MPARADAAGRAAGANGWGLALHSAMLTGDVSGGVTGGGCVWLC